MEIWRKVINIVQTFTYILAGITICTAIYITLLLKDTDFNISLLWEVIAMSAVCALGNLIYYYKDILNMKQMIIRMVCHYLYINIIVFSGAYLWTWLTPGVLPEFLFMLLLIAVVYGIIMVTTFHKEKKIAENFNRELRKRYPSQEE